MIASTDNNEVIDDKVMWKRICLQWPEMHLINIGIRYAKTISRRFRTPYCRTSWFKGTSVAGGGLINIGLDRATNMIVVRNHIPLANVSEMVYELMPSCDAEGCCVQ